MLFYLFENFHKCVLSIWAFVRNQSGGRVCVSVCVRARELLNIPLFNIYYMSVCVCVWARAYIPWIRHKSNYRISFRNVDHRKETTLYQFYMLIWKYLWNLITKTQKRKSNQMFFPTCSKHITTQTFARKQNDNNRNDDDGDGDGEEIERVWCIEEIKQFWMEFNRLFEFIILCIWVKGKWAAAGKKRNISRNKPIDEFLIGIWLKCTLIGQCELICDQVKWKRKRRRLR